MTKTDRTAGRADSGIFAVCAMRVSLTVLLAVTLAGCSHTLEEPQDNPVHELTLSCIVSRVTKGYLTGTVLEETPSDQLHAASKTPSPRDIRISAWLHPQTGEESAYFTDNVFRRSADGYWHNCVGGIEAPIFWPVGGDLDFLAYSVSSTSSLTSKAVWDAVNNASRVSIPIASGDCLQDDIVFSSAYRKSVSHGDEPVSDGRLTMQFHHSQAWIEFNLSTSVDGGDGGDPAVTVTGLVLENIYTSGDLTIHNDGGDATCSWSFRTASASDMTVVGTPLGLAATPTSFDFLLPEQKRTAFTLSYRLGETEKVFVKHVELPHSTWLMGYKYIYDITFKASELTISPSCEVWNGNEEYNVEL